MLAKRIAFFIILMIKFDFYKAENRFRAFDWLEIIKRLRKNQKFYHPFWEQWFLHKIQFKNGNKFVYSFWTKFFHNYLLINQDDCFFFLKSLDLIHPSRKRNDRFAQFSDFILKKNLIKIFFCCKKDFVAKNIPRQKFCPWWARDVPEEFLCLSQLVHCKSFHDTTW